MEITDIKVHNCSDYKKSVSATICRCIMIGNCFYLSLTGNTVEVIDILTHKDVIIHSNEYKNMLEYKQMLTDTGNTVGIVYLDKNLKMRGILSMENFLRYTVEI